MLAFGALKKWHLRHVALATTLLLGQASCSSNSSGSSGTAVPANTAKPFTFAVSLPGYPNTKFSAYIFGGGALVGVVRSNTMTDSQGNLTATAVGVDANNCATSAAVPQTASVYTIHARLDGANSGNFVYPSSCLGDAGFLQMANLGYAQVYTSAQLYWPMQLNYMNTTSTIYYQFSNTGLSIARQTYCSLVDGQITSPTIYTSSTLGFWQKSVAFAGGSGNTTSTFFAPYASAGTYKHACWIDFDGSGTYNSGDKVGTSTDSYSMSTWTVVP